MTTTNEQDIIEAIRMFIGKDEGPLDVEEPLPEEPGIKVRVKPPELPVKIVIKDPIRVYLQIRRSLDGNYMIFDHPLFDVVIQPNTNKIVTFSKRTVSTDPYPSQDKFFDFLMRKGMLKSGSIQGGNVYGALEAEYPVNDEVDTVEALLLVIYYFMKDEVADVKAALMYADELEDSYTDPDDEDSTELGEVPHKEKKGSIDPGYKPYGLIYRL